MINEQTSFRAVAPEGCELKNIISCTPDTIICLFNVYRGSSVQLESGQTIPCPDVAWSKVSVEELGFRWRPKDLNLLARGLDEIEPGVMRATFPLYFSEQFFIFQEAVVGTDMPKFGVKTYQGTTIYFPENLIPLGVTDSGLIHIEIKEEGKSIGGLGFIEEDQIKVSVLFWPKTNLQSDLLAMTSSQLFCLLSPQGGVCVYDAIFKTTTYLEHPLKVQDLSEDGIALGVFNLGFCEELLARLELNSPANTDMTVCGTGYWNSKGQPGVFSVPMGYEFDPILVRQVQTEHIFLGSLRNNLNRTEVGISTPSACQIAEQKVISVRCLSDQVTGDVVVRDAFKMTPRGVILGELDFGDQATRRGLILPRH